MKIVLSVLCLLVSSLTSITAFAHDGHGVESQFHVHADDIALTLLAVVIVFAVGVFIKRGKNK